ncbi:MAG: carbamoyl-phosphate synthase large subunit, partial [Clostridia bacterium]|nr:carbamoyl-phosphate synthase large subunit [Clostridia bacterium]
TEGTARYLKEHGIRTRIKEKISSGSTDIYDTIRQGHIAYVINTSDVGSSDQQMDGYEIRKLAVETGTTMFTSLDTVRVLLDVLEDITITISTIDA